MEKNLEDIRKNIIEDYSNWVLEALGGKADKIGIHTIAVDNFALKLDGLISMLSGEKYKICGN